MSRTHDFLIIAKPKSFPFVKAVTFEKSVTSISFTSEPESDGNLNFVIGPTYMGSPSRTRKLCFSLEQNPELDFEYTQVGKETIDGKDVYLLLENLEEAKEEDTAVQEVKKCRDYKCRKGTVQMDAIVMLITGCSSRRPTHPCSECGRLHWPDGSPVSNRSGHRVFRKNGETFNLDRKGKKLVTG